MSTFKTKKSNSFVTGDRIGQSGAKRGKKAKKTPGRKFIGRF